MEKYVVSVAVNGRLIVDANSIEEANDKAFRLDFHPEDLFNGEVIEVFDEFDDDNDTVTLRQWREAGLPLNQSSRNTPSSPYPVQKT